MEDGQLQRDYYRATTDGAPEYLRSETAEREPGRAWGRCPDCGEAVEVETRMHQPARVLPHGCPARVCEYPDCRIITPPEGMVQFAHGPRYCPSHELLLVAKTLVLLYRVEGDADWSSVGGDTLAGGAGAAWVALGESAQDHAEMRPATWVDLTDVRD